MFSLAGNTDTGLGFVVHSVTSYKAKLVDKFMATPLLGWGCRLGPAGSLPPPPSTFTVARLLISGSLLILWGRSQLGN